MCINDTLQLELIQFKNTLQKELIKYKQKLSKKKIKHLKYILKRSNFATFDMLLYRKTKRICIGICMIKLTQDTIDIYSIIGDLKSMVSVITRQKLLMYNLNTRNKMQRV